MDTALNPQKILRTGDKVIDTRTNSLGTIHYVVEKGGQLTFEREVSFLESVLIDNGEKIIDVPIENIQLNRRRNGNGRTN